MRRAAGNVRGFTLLEVMVAVAIVAMISTLVWGSFARTFDARDMVERMQVRYHGIRIALERMSREISQAFVYDCRERDTPTGEHRFRTLFKVEKEGDLDRMVFNSFSHLRLQRDAHESDQNVLTYYGEDDPEDSSKNNLMRKEKARIDGEPEEGGDGMVLCPDVKSLRFELWDEVKNDWVDEWDCSQVERLNQLPRLVRITLTVADDSGKELPFTTMTRIFANKPLANWIKPSQ